MGKLNRKRPLIISLLISILFVFLLMPTANALFAEWWEMGTSGVRIEPNRRECGNDGTGDATLKITVPKNSEVKVRIPRSYKMGWANDMSTLVADMQNNIGTYEDCAAADAAELQGELQPPGPYVCVKSDDSNAKSKVRVSFSVINELEGVIAGSVYDGGQVYTALWPAHTILSITSFRTKQASEEPTYDYINPETNQSVQGSVGTLDTKENEFTPETIVSINALSNGREGEGDPYYYVVEINNKHKSCKDEGCVTSYAAEHPSDFNGPEWESGLDGWDATAGNLSVKQPDYIDESNFWDSFSSYGDQHGNWIIPNIVGLFKVLFGWRAKVCVFGCHDVDVEFTVTQAHRMFYAVSRQEQVGSDDYSTETDSLVCNLHSSYTTPELGYLDDGYKYWCDANGTYMRSDMRISCTNKLSMQCKVEEGTSNELNGGQGHYANPTQVLNDPTQTEKNYIEGFTNPKTKAVNGGLHASTGKDVDIDFATLISSFDPDKKKEICEAQGCAQKYNWLGTNGSSSATNACCGDDVSDNGYINYFNNTYYACTMLPDGRFEWLATNGTNKKIAGAGEVKGNIYEITKKTVGYANYTYTRLTYTDSGDVISTPVSYTYSTSTNSVSGYSLDYSIVTDGQKWFSCSGKNNFSFNGPSSIISQGITAQKLVKVSIGGIVSVHDNSGMTHEYVCTNESGVGRFVECFGETGNLNKFDYGWQNTGASMFWSSYSATYPNSVNRLGSFETLPLTYENWGNFTNTSTTSITSAKFTETKKSLKLFSASSNNSSSITSVKIPITNFGNYTYLEGEFYYDILPLVEISFANKSYNPNDYTTSKSEALKFNHFQIPLTGLGANSIVNNITIRINRTNSLYSNISNMTFYVDNLNLIRSGLRYCGYINNTFKWQNSRDNPKSCSAVGLDFTGKRCCGEQTGEYYNDGNSSGCWNSYPISNTTRFLVAELKLNNLNFSFVCKADNDCSYAIPRTAIIASTNGNITLQNLRSDKYDVSFLSGSSNTTSNILDRIVITPKYWELMAINNSFRYCGDTLPTYNYNITNNNPINKYTSPDFNLSKISYTNGGSCTYTDQYFCSPSRGWLSSSDDVEPIDIVNETFPAGDCKINSTDIRCKKIDPSERTAVKSLPTDSRLNINSSLPRQECCPQDYCWNGAICVEDESNEAFRSPNFIFESNGNGYRCIKGNWSYSYKKLMPSGNQKGYCEDNQLCLVNRYGIYYPSNFTVTNTSPMTNPQCAKSLTYSNDYYCNQGNWTSRTALLANVLRVKASTVGAKYSIFCGSYQEVLNYAAEVNGKALGEYIYPANNQCKINFGGVIVSNCMNNFCVLNKDGKVSFGTTLNQRLDNTNLSYSELFNNFGLTQVQLSSKINSSIASASSLNPTDLVLLTGSISGGYWYYVPSINGIVYSELLLSSSQFETLITSITNMFKLLFGWVSGSDSSSSVLFTIQGFDNNADLAFLKDYSRYDRLYLLETPNVKVKAISGQQYSFTQDNYISFIAGEYSLAGVPPSYDLCNYIKSFDSRYNPEDVDIVCAKSNGKYYLYSKGSVNIWPDLTAKLNVMK